jgi:hypothetical protein
MSPLSRSLILVHLATQCKRICYLCVMAPAIMHISFVLHHPFAATNNSLCHTIRSSGTCGLQPCDWSIGSCFSSKNRMLFPSFFLQDQNWLDRFELCGYVNMSPAVVYMPSYRACKRICYLSVPPEAPAKTHISFVVLHFSSLSSYSPACKLLIHHVALSVGFPGWQRTPACARLP